MPRSKKVAHYNEDGKRICGARVKAKSKAGPGRICQRAAMHNGKCYLHGGKSPGPKNSVAYYKKQVLEAPGGTRLSDALGMINPLDLTGEIGLVRTLLTQMMDDPLKAYCQSCKKDVVVDITCPNEAHDNAMRAEKGKGPISHYVRVKDNDFSKMVTATKQLSEVVKNHKEIQKGKEITIRIEVLNLMVIKIVEAYEQADRIADPVARKRKFIEGVDRLLLEPATSEALERGTAQTTNRR